LQHSVNLPYRVRKQEWDFTRAALEGSTFLNIPKFLQPFTNGIEYHHIHHLNTNVASYNIAECHYSFEEGDKVKRKWDDYQINRVDFCLAFKSLFNVMLD
jgi:omega-6 fatty acid desaturase (delta-12 desaturase)